MEHPRRESWRVAAFVAAGGVALAYGGLLLAELTGRLPLPQFASLLGVASVFAGTIAGVRSSDSRPATAAILGIAGLAALACQGLVLGDYGAGLELLMWVSAAYHLFAFGRSRLARILGAVAVGFSGVAFAAVFAAPVLGSVRLSELGAVLAVGSVAAGFGANGFGGLKPRSSRLAVPGASSA